MNYHIVEARYVTDHVVWLRFRTTERPLYTSNMQLTLDLPDCDPNRLGGLLCMRLPRRQSSIAFSTARSTSP
jgi:hypothetical protein